MWPSAASRRCAGRSRVPSSSVNPVIACSGVRSSWLSADDELGLGPARRLGRVAGDLGLATGPALLLGGAALGDVEQVHREVHRRTPSAPRTADAATATRTTRPSMCRASPRTARSQRRRAQADRGRRPGSGSTSSVSAAAEQAALRAPEHLLQRAVDLDDPAVEAGQRHADGVVLERALEPFRALGERPVEPGVVDRDRGQVGEALDEPLLAGRGSVGGSGRRRTCRGWRRGRGWGSTSTTATRAASARSRNRVHRASDRDVLGHHRHAQECRRTAGPGVGPDGQPVDLRRSRPTAATGPHRGAA